MSLNLRLPNIRRWILLLFLTCFALVFAHSLQGQFVYDDIRWIRDNAFIRDPANLQYFLSGKYFAGSGEMTWRPLVTFSYMVDTWLLVPHPFGYRLHNLLLHLGVCLLLWRILFDATGSRAAAWWATFFFAFHPMQVEPVAVAGLREDLQCTFFILAGWLALRHGGRWMLAGVAFAFALALLAKETAVIFPLLVAVALALGVLSFKRETPVKAHTGIALCAVLAGYVWLRFFVLRNPLEQSLSYLGGSVWTSLLTHQTAWSKGVLDILFPWDLTIDPWVPTQTSPWNRVVLLSGIIWLMVAAVMVWAWKHNRRIAFGLVWFFAALLPVSGIIPIANVYADRYFYLPMAGLAFCFGAFVSKLDPRWCRWLIPVGVFWLVWLAVLTHQRVTTFHDNPALWNDALEKAGRKPWPMNILSFSLHRAEEPLALLQERTVRDPANAKNWTRLAAGYLQRQDLPNARRAFQISLQKDPGNPETHLMLGDAYAQMRRDADAQSHYEKAIALYPGYAEAHNNLGVLFLNQENYPRAKEEFSKALVIQPQGTAAMSNLAALKARQGDTEAAFRLWQEVLRFDSYNAAARFNLLRLKNRGRSSGGAGQSQVVKNP